MNVSVQGVSERHQCALSMERSLSTRQLEAFAQRVRQPARLTMQQHDHATDTAKERSEVGFGLLG